MKEKIYRFFIYEISGWKKIEVGWLLVACLVIASLSLYWGDSLVGIVSAITGVACVVCTGKGKLSAYLFGLVNCVLYAYISYQVKLYGETMLNTIYYVPMQFVGFFLWSQNINQETFEVRKKHMQLKWRILTIAAMVGLTYVYGLFLKYLGGTMPFVDAFTTVSSVIAMAVSVKMFAEQWWIWIVVDIFTVYMWFINFMQGNDNLSTLLMWIVYLGNAIIMCVKWEKEARRSEKIAV